MNNELREIIKKEFDRRRENEDYSKKITVGFPVYDEKEILAALDCLLNLRLSQGPIVNSFEKLTSNYMDVKYVT